MYEVASLRKNELEINNLALKFRQSLDCNEILKIASADLRKLLNSDRILIYSRSKNSLVVEALSQQKWSIIWQNKTNFSFSTTSLEFYRQGKFLAIGDLEAEEIEQTHRQFWRQFQVKAYLVIPIILPATQDIAPDLWGLIIVNECQQPRQWQLAEIDLVKEIAYHLAIAIQQAESIVSRQPKITMSIKELQLSQERLQLALESSGDGLWDWNTTTAEAYYSSQWYRMLGYQPNEFPANYENWEKLVHPDDKPWVIATLQSHLRDDSVPYCFDYRLRTKSGNWKWIANYGKVVSRDRQGKAIRMVGTHKDISDRKRVEAEIISKSDELADFSYNLKQLHRLNTTNYLSFKKLFNDYLRTGCTIFQCSTGIVSRIKGNSYHICAVQSSLPSLAPKQTFTLANTFCAEVVKTKKTVAYNHIGTNERLNRHPVYQNLNLECYISTPILIDGRVYGTLNFSGTKPREREFSTHEYEIIELMAQSIGKSLKAYQIEKQRQQAVVELKKAKAELEIRVVQRTAQLQKANQLLQEELEKREKAQAALEESETRFQTMANCFPMLMWIANEKGKCTFFNKAWLDYTKRNLEEELGYGWTKEIHPDDFVNCVTAYQEAVESRQPFQNEYRLRRWDKEYRWMFNYGVPRFRPNGSFAGYIGSCMDISDRKKIEATLQESERRWRTLLDNMPLLIVAFDLQGQVKYANPYLLKFTEYKKEEIIGCNWNEKVVHPEYRQKAKKVFKTILKPNASSLNHLKVILTKSGEEKVITWNSTQLRNHQGKPIGMICIGVDITERHAVEKMKDEFISVVSHELRTPLTAVRGALSLLAGGVVTPESTQGKKTLKIAAESTERLVRLVNDILELERLQSGKIELVKQKINAKELIQKAIEQVQIIAEKADICLKLQKANVTVYGDSDRLIQVLTNLLTNAIKFSPPNSSVCVCARIKYPENAEQQPYVLFIVKDQGRGIPSEKLETIFERFHQVDASDSRQKGGTGLGLSICRNIIEQHNGKIWVESTTGKGSTFYFTIPMAD